MNLFPTGADETLVPGFTTYIGNVLTALLGWVESVFETMVSSPIVLFFVILAVIGAIVGFTKKILM